MITIKFFKQDSDEGEEKMVTIPDTVAKAKNFLDSCLERANAHLAKSNTREHLQASLQSMNALINYAQAERIRPPFDATVHSTHIGL